MFRSIKIEGYRGLHSFRMESLKRVNLLVGTNNSGKTSILEALYILGRSGDPVILYNLMQRRGEKLPEDPETRSSESELDLSHLFSGHEIEPGSRFSIEGENAAVRRISFTIVEDETEDKTLFSPDDGRTRPILEIEGVPNPPFSGIPLTSRGGLTSNAIQSIRRLQRPPSSEQMPGVYVSADSINADSLVRLWDRLALTEDESFVLEALRYIDPSIERIAAISSNRTFSNSPTRGGFIVKLEGHVDPIPIGSMGDGMWRMLAMAISITQSRGGLLLIDEIDTGLHYTVMDGMWNMLYRAARNFNVQVFATTHSYDCVQSLSKSCLGENGFTLQRVESGRAVSVPYSSDEIRVAADRGVEVR